MTLHTDWTDAKKDNKAKFKAASKAKSAALEKLIKEGDAKARAKALNKALGDLGIEDGGDDVDKYFSFKEDFGPNLDKLAKAAAGLDKIKQAIAKITGFEAVLKDSKLSKAFGVFAKRKFMEETWVFITVGYKADPMKAYDMFIRPGSKLEINVDGKSSGPLHAIADNPAQMKALGPALLVRCRTELIGNVGADATRQFRASPEAMEALGGTALAAEVTTLKKKVGDTVTSYKKQVEASEAKWKGIAPDFRKPLVTALDNIKNSVNAITVA
jgi:hypothetical protein